MDHLQLLQWPSTPLLTSTFLGSKGRDLVYDLFTKKTPMVSFHVFRPLLPFKIEEAAKPSLIKSHEDFAAHIYEESQAKVHFVLGDKRRKFLQRKWPQKFKNIKGVGKYRVCEAEVNGRMRLFIFLPHPEYVKTPKWRGPASVRRVVKVLREVQVLIVAMDDDSLDDFIIALDGLEEILTSDKAIASAFQVRKVKMQ